MEKVCLAVKSVNDNGLRQYCGKIFTVNDSMPVCPSCNSAQPMIFTSCHLQIEEHHVECVFLLQVLECYNSHMCSMAR